MDKKESQRIVPLRSRKARKKAAPAARATRATGPAEDRLAQSMPVKLNREQRRDRGVREVFEEGNKALRDGHYVAAAQRYRRALLLGGELAEAYNNLAVACHRQGFFAEARRAVDRALDLDPRNALYFHNAALIARDAAEPHKAIEYFAQALALEPASASILQARGMLYHSIRKYREALADLERALEMDPTLPGLAAQVAVAASNAGDASRARELFNRMTAAQPSDPEPYYNLGFISLTMGDTESAARYLEKALELAPGHPPASFQLAALYARRRDEGDNRARAMTILETCLAANPGQDVRTGKQLAPVHFLLASLHDDTTEGYEQAIAHYRQGLEYDPDFYVAHNNVGALYLEMGDAERALDHFERSLSISPTYAKAALNFAKALYHKGTQAEVEARIESLLVATGRHAPATMAMIAQRLIDIAEHEVYAEVHERDHKIKNLLGLTGNKLRRVRSKSPEGAELDEALAVLKDAYDSMSNYLKAIRPQSSHVERVDLNGVVERVAASLEQSRPEGLELHVSLAQELPPVLGEPARFEEAVLNLATNAVEALAGPGRISLGTRFEESRGLSIVYVEDNGPGIGPNMREAIFRTGYTTKPTGSGLGLSIVRRTVADAYGTLQLQSEPGKYTRFTLQFPIERDSIPRAGGLSMNDAFRENPGDLIVSELT